MASSCDHRQIGISRFFALCAQYPLTLPNANTHDAARFPQQSTNFGAIYDFHILYSADALPDRVIQQLARE